MPQVAERLGYGVFLVEKAVTQPVAEYESLLEASERLGLSIWVIYKTWAYRFHRQAKSKVKPGELIISSKCGPAIHDLSGTSATGSHMTIGSRASIEQGYITLLVSGYSFIIDHISKKASESDVDTDRQWWEAVFDENVAVSFMTRYFSVQIMETSRRDLPTMQEAFARHEGIRENEAPAVVKEALWVYLARGMMKEAQAQFGKARTGSWYREVICNTPRSQRIWDGLCSWLKLPGQGIKLPAPLNPRSQYHRDFMPIYHGAIAAPPEIPVTTS